MSTRPWRLRPRAGFSLIELLTVISVLAVVMAIAAPRVADVNVQRNVRGARAAVANLYARARVRAVQTRKPVTLQFNDSLAWITSPRGAALDTVGGLQNLKAQFGVTIAATGAISVQPTGLVNAGAPVKVSVTKYGHTDSVVISGYGKMQ
jgi:prepilin-type N-terminal cleavage/methylation domain-containing protein